jgi:putative ABC transport system permease protein
LRKSGPAAPPGGESSALAVVLLVAAGLLLRTFSNLLRVDLGFQPAGTVTMNLFLGVRPPEAQIALLDRILDRVEALPGVAAAGTIQFLSTNDAQKSSDHFALR